MGPLTKPVPERPEAPHSLIEDCTASFTAKVVDTPKRKPSAPRPFRKFLNLSLHSACSLHQWDTVEDIVKYNPEATSQANEVKRYPLHCLFESTKRGNSFDNNQDLTHAVTVLLTADASQAILKAQDKYGSTPLHMALMQRYPLEAVELLIEACPEALEKADLSGSFPLCSVGMEVSGMSLQEEEDYAIQVYDIVLTKVPSFLTTVYGFNLIHNAVLRNLPCGVFRMLARAVPTEAFGQVNKVGNLPLHEFCDPNRAASIMSTSSREAYLYTLDMLINAFPDALDRPDRHGRYPIHMLISHSPRIPLNKLAWIIQSYPHVAELRDANNLCAVHYTILSQYYSAENIISLLNVNYTVFQQHVEANVPVLQWCARTNRTGLLAKVIARYPELLFEVDLNGQTLLHFAILNQNTGQCQWSAKLILKEAPILASIADNSGRLPLHWLAAQDQHDQDSILDIFETRLTQPSPQETLVEALITAHPEATQVHDSKGMYPLHIWRGHDVKEGRVLLEADPSSPAYRCSAGKIPLQYLVEQPSGDGETSRRCHHECVVLLLDATVVMPNTESDIKDAMIRAATCDLDLDTILAMVHASVGMLGSSNHRGNLGGSAHRQAEGNRLLPRHLSSSYDSRKRKTPPIG